MDPGQFDEPVGLAIDAEGQVYVADTWNQRIQVFQEDESGSFMPFRSWDVPGWYGQSLDNKPYMAVDNRARSLLPIPKVTGCCSSPIQASRAGLGRLWRRPGSFGLPASWRSPRMAVSGWATRPTAG